MTMQVAFFSKKLSAEDKAAFDDITEEINSFLSNLNHPIRVMPFFKVYDDAVFFFVMVVYEEETR